MSREKQIEELAKKLKAYCYDIELHDIDDCRRLADFIIDTLGYRKQSEGEWEQRTDVVGFVRCSVCKDCNVYDEWAHGKKWNYCPHCGAKMKGGAE